MTVLVVEKSVFSCSSFDIYDYVILSKGLMLSKLGDWGEKGIETSVCYLELFLGHPLMKILTGKVA